MNIEEQLKQFLAKNETAEAIQLLKEATQNKLSLNSELLLLEGQFHKLQQARRTNTEDVDKLQLRENKINQSLLRISNKTFHTNAKAISSIPPKLTFRDVTYALRYTLTQTLRKPAQNALIWLLAIIILLLSFSYFTEWIEIDEALTGQLLQSRLSIIIGSLILFTWLIFNKTRQLLQKNLKLKWLKVNDSTLSPIKGLHHFNFDDADIFKALQRNDDIETCLNGIMQSGFRFGVLSGESGCGKTSFLRAGLHPALEQKKLSCVVVKLTNEPPLDSIKKALSQQLGCSLKKIQQIDLYSTIQVALGHTTKEGLVLILDQFEQFFTHQKTQENRKAFISQLQKCYKDLPELRMVLSLRRDFLGRLHEIQKILDYPLRARYNYFDLDKFTAQQAASIFHVIAEAEGMEYDEHFVQELCREELTSKEDGLISAADIQIIAFIIKAQQSHDKAFTSTVFQRLGGIEGLLQRFLQEQLETPNYYNTDQAALKVLLTFIDLDNNVRAGELKLAEIQQKLADNQFTILLPTILNWLVDLRLVSKTISSKNEEVYELSHERLILPLCNLIGRTLDEVERANQILNKRTNEWLANQKRGRFLPSWKEYSLIHHQQKRQLIRWGKNKKWKEKLLKAARQRFALQFSVAFLAIFMVLSWVYVPKTNWYIFDREIPNALESLILGSLSISEQKKILPNLQLIDVRFSYATIVEINDTNAKDQAYVKLVRDLTSSQVVNRYNVIPKAAIDAANLIENSDPKYAAFQALARAAALLGDTTRAITYIQQSMEFANDIRNPSKQSGAFSTIIRSRIQIHDTTRLLKYIQRALAVAGQDENVRSQSATLNKLVQSAASLRDTLGTITCLRKAVKVASQIKDLNSRASTISGFAGTAARIGDTTLAIDFVRQAYVAALEIKNENVQRARLRNIAGMAAVVGNSSITLACLQQAMKSSLNIKDEKVRAGSFRDIAQTIGRINDVPLALGLLEQVSKFANQFKERQSQFKILQAIHQSSFDIGKRDNLEQAIQVAGQMTDPSQQTDAFLILAKDVAKQGDTILSQSLLQRATAAAQRIKDATSQYDNINNTAQVALQLGDTSQALQLLQEIAKQANLIKIIKLPPYSFTAIARTIARTGDTTLALNYVKQATKLAEHIDAATARVNTINAITNLTLRFSDTTLALTFLGLAADAANKIEDPRGQSNAYKSIASIAKGMKKTALALDYLRQATRLAYRIEDANSQSRTLSGIISEAAKLGSREGLEHALNTTQQIKDAKSQNVALNSIAVTAARIDDQASWQQVIKIGRQIEDPSKQAATFSLFVRTAVQFNNHKVVTDLEEIVQSINGLENQAILLEALVTAHSKFGQYCEAYQLANKMPASNAKMKALAYLNLMKAWKEKEAFIPVTIKW